MAQQRIPIRTHGAMRQQFVFEADGAYIHSQQDCTPLLEDNKRRSNEFKGTTKNGTAIAARVPAILRYMEWPTEFEMKYGCHPDNPPADMPFDKRLELGAAWSRFYLSKLDNRDYSKIRTDGGKRLGGSEPLQFSIPRTYRKKAKDVSGRKIA